MTPRLVHIPVLMGILAGMAMGDFSYQQTTKITGGALADMMRMAGPLAKKAGEPQTSTVMVKGGRMANVHKDSMSVVDISARTITEVNFEKKTYSVMTFDELKKAYEELQRRMAAPGDAQMDFKVDVKETGATKKISGLDTREMVMTIQLTATDPKTNVVMTTEVVADSWLTSELAGYSEVRDFYKHMAESTGWVPGMQMGMSQPGMSEGMIRLQKESARLQGVPVLQITKVTGPGGQGMPDMSGAPAGPSSKDATDAAADAARRSAEQEAVWQASRSGGAAGRIGGAALGGMMGGFGKKKTPPPAPKKEETPPPAAAASTAKLLMETTTEMSGHSNASIADSKFEVPSGFQKVENEMLKVLKQQAR